MQEPKSRGDRLRFAAAVALGVPVIALLFYLLAYYGFASEPRADLLAPSILANLREVDPGRFYRSGQLTGPQLGRTVERLGIRTIINLRGHSTHWNWYREEAATAERMGISLHNIHLSSRSLPHRDELLHLLRLYRSAERPILVHCDGGADRAGEASAIYQIEYMGKSRKEALDMLSFRYRHVSWLKPAKRYFIERYGGAEWVRDGYDPCSPDFEYYDKLKYCRADS